MQYLFVDLFMLQLFSHSSSMLEQVTYLYMSQVTFLTSEM